MESAVSCVLSKNIPSTLLIVHRVYYSAKLLHMEQSPCAVIEILDQDSRGGVVQIN